MSMKMKAVQVSKPGGDWELVERDIPEPGPGLVRGQVVKGSGHWLMEEAPGTVIPAIIDFLN